jgi:hypothetical protein
MNRNFQAAEGDYFGRVPAAMGEEHRSERSHY